ncbi:HAD family hydrolase [Streptomyces litmocidini]|uniref:HAD family hydrolase n=1 Tax=Streptomyces litmocidini TaxID=67318 RepID=UPI0036F95F5A
MTGAGAPPTARVEAVVLDYGGVLTGPVKESIAAWIEADGIDPASFSRTLKAWMSRGAPAGTPVHRLETGELTVAEFDALLAARLTTVDGRPVDPVGVLSRLFAGMRPDPAMFALVEELRALGVRVALLSNSWGNTYPRERLDALLDPVVVSGEVGLRKPAAPIYELTLARLGVAAGNAVFVDDAEPNVLGARAVGMRAHLHVDAPSTRAALAALVPGLRSTPNGPPHDHPEDTWD